MNEMEYRNRMIAIRYAELALLESIANNIATLASEAGKRVDMNWDRTMKVYANAWEVTSKFPPG